MKDKVITEIQNKMARLLNHSQLDELGKVINAALTGVELVVKADNELPNHELLNVFLSAKRIEGCSEKSIKYYQSTIKLMIERVVQPIRSITTDHLRGYLSEYQKKRGSSKVTIDNMRRIFSSFFGWLEDEDYILKSPVRRIHKIKTDKPIKELVPITPIIGNAMIIIPKMIASKLINLFFIFFLRINFNILYIHIFFL